MVSKSKKTERQFSLADLIELTSLSKATIYRKVKDGSFPAPAKISSQRVAWWESDIAQWQEAKRTAPRAA